MRPELTVVVPTLQTEEEIPVTSTLRACSFEDYELILRDDEPVTKARNEGIARAKANKIIFLDDDSEVEPGYLSLAAEILESEMAFAGRTIHPRDDIFATHFTGHYSFGDEPGYVDRFWGNNMGVRKEVFEAVGGWDENIGWGHEEKDLARRVIEEFDIYYDPNLVVYHPYADSLVDFWKKQHRLERQAPYCWDKEGISKTEKLRRVVNPLFDPWNYLGRTPVVAAARTGRTLMRFSGRVSGLVTHWRRQRQ
ncbi:glycosyltransferase family 2 protein [Haloarcula litorea]|uniref:glycosyltransferase family 2 protein n=1 Tax=Haloarcula litorea TaxID=3032579 RepID=UPI0023E8A3F7|nr:glycosyltransferase [Halomicroarcula sp. GDY20]